MSSLASLLVFTLVGFFVIGHAKPSPNEEKSTLLDVVNVVGESEGKTVVSETETVESKKVVDAKVSVNEGTSTSSDVANEIGKSDGKKVSSEIETVETKQVVTEEKIDKKQEDSSLTKGETNTLDKDYANEIDSKILEQAQATSLNQNKKQNSVDWLYKFVQHILGSVIGNVKKIANGIVQNQKKDDKVVKLDTTSYGSTSKGSEQSTTEVTEKTSETKTTELENKDSNSNMDLRIGVPETSLEKLNNGHRQE